MVVGLMLVACGRNVTWVDVTIDGKSNTPFRVQEEYVHDPVHGFVPRSAVEPSERERVLYKGKVIATITTRQNGYVMAYWPTSAHLYSWFRFRKRTSDGKLVGFKEIIGRFDLLGTFQVCKDITPLEDRHLTLMFSDVVNDSTFRFYRATGPKDTLEYLLVKISKCRTVDIKKWLKEEREAKAVPASFRATPQGAEAATPPPTSEPR